MVYLEKFSSCFWFFEGKSPPLAVQTAAELTNTIPLLAGVLSLFCCPHRAGCKKALYPTAAKVKPVLLIYKLYYVKIVALLNI
jgi:hypothetical protein